MRVEVDQSGRIDQTDRPTVLALANGKKYSICISATTKRECLHQLRQKWRGVTPTPNLYVLVFATSLYLLLKSHISHLTQVVIDTELPGHEGTIKDHLLNLCWRSGLKITAEVISFRQIGKKSPAHDAAIQVFRGKVQPNQKVSVKDLLDEFGD
jgi:hypothetical protein